MVDFNFSASPLKSIDLVILDMLVVWGFSLMRKRRSQVCNYEMLWVVRNAKKKNRCTLAPAPHFSTLIQLTGILRLLLLPPCSFVMIHFFKTHSPIVKSNFCAIQCVCVCVHFLNFQVENCRRIFTRVSKKPKDPKWASFSCKYWCFSSLSLIRFQFSRFALFCFAYKRFLVSEWMAANYFENILW